MNIEELEKIKLTLKKENIQKHQIKKLYFGIIKIQLIQTLIL